MYLRIKFLLFDIYQNIITILDIPYYIKLSANNDNIFLATRFNTNLY